MMAKPICVSNIFCKVHIKTKKLQKVFGCIQRCEDFLGETLFAIIWTISSQVGVQIGRELVRFTPIGLNKFLIIITYTMSLKKKFNVRHFDNPSSKKIEWWFEGSGEKVLTISYNKKYPSS